MLQSIGTCLWFDGKAKEAALYYKEVFGDVEIISENPMAVVYQIFGRRFMNLNGGPGFNINPSISFFLSMENEAKTKSFWEKLTVDGKILMPLNKYPWSDKYGWCADKYGVNWQLMLGHKSKSKLMPNMLFTGQQNGKANEAIHYYTNLFKGATVINIDTYKKEIGRAHV